jgi:uncharacterized protein
VIDSVADIFGAFDTTLRSHYASSGPCHDLSHVLRVASLAGRLAKLEGHDQRLAVLAGLFHDIGHAAAGAAGADDHEVRSSAIVGEVLMGRGYPAREVEVVQRAIEAHRFTKESDRRVDGVGAALLDADRLDAIGLIGVSRAYLWLGEHGWHVPRDLDQTRLLNLERLREHWRAKLQVISTQMYTGAGRRLASERARRMASFIEGLAAELEA